MLPITLALPIYNEEKFILKTLHSVRSQPVEEIIISDNCSTDETMTICAAAASEDSRIRIISHSQNYGPFANFRCCLENSTMPFFMFVGGHDILSENHAIHLLETLHNTSGAVGAYTNALFLDYEQKRYVRAYEYSFYKYLLYDNPLERLTYLVRNFCNGTIMHGLYIKNKWKDAFFHDKYVPQDIFPIGYMAIQGKLALNKKIYYTRTNNHIEDSTQYMQRYNELIQKYYPEFQKMTRNEIFGAGVARLFNLLDSLYPKLNLI